VSVLRDDQYFESPLGGILTGLNHTKEDFVAVLACDTPFVKAAVVRYLFASAAGHDAAVPVWDENDKMSTEPLCAVYNVESTRRAILTMIEERRRKACREMILMLPKTNFVPISALRDLDESLGSFKNINTKEQYAEALAEVGGARPDGVFQFSRG